MEKYWASAHGTAIITDAMRRKVEVTPKEKEWLRKKWETAKRSGVREISYNESRVPPVSRSKKLDLDRGCLRALGYGFLFWSDRWEDR